MSKDRLVKLLTGDHWASDFANDFIRVFGSEEVTFHMSELRYALLSAVEYGKNLDRQRGTIIEGKHPWELDASKVKVITSFDAKVVQDAGLDYAIDFIDNNGVHVEAKITKDEFKVLPHEVGAGTEFWVVVYSFVGQPGMMISVWPIAKYWHESWSSDER